MDITKLGAVESQLEAAAYLMLRAFRPEPVHTLIGAARGILYGLSISEPNRVLEKWDANILFKVVGDDKKIRSYQNRVANFLKHADRDPDKALANVDLSGLNELELQLCIYAFMAAKPVLTPRLWLGLLFLSLQKRGALVSFDQLLTAVEATLAPHEFSKKWASMREIEGNELRSICLELFEKV